jgi:hypothetical protein
VRRSKIAGLGQAALDLRHLRREARTALELAVVALAPSQIVDRLATAAGLLEALAKLPQHSPPVVATVPRAITRARSGLDEWGAWLEQHRGRRIPRS